MSLKFNTKNNNKHDKPLHQSIDGNILSDYTIQRQIGKGAYGIVYKSYNKINKQLVAIKKIFDAFRNKTDAQRTYREIYFLLTLKKHPNIIKMLDIYRAQNNKDLYVVFEYMENDLNHVIRKKILKDIHIKYIMFQLCNGINYIHNCNIIHRDLKPSNILIDSNCCIKIADLGLARLLSSNTNLECLTEYIATRWYRAPEILMSETSYSKQIDIWSLGCILAEMILSKPLFPGSSTCHQLQLIISILQNDNSDNTPNSKFYTMFQGKPEKSVNLLTKILILDPDNRPSATEILKDNFISEYFPSKTHPIPEVEPESIVLNINDDEQIEIHEYQHQIYNIISNIKKSASFSMISKQKKQTIKDKNYENQIVSNKLHNSVNKENICDNKNGDNQPIAALVKSKTYLITNNKQCVNHINRKNIKTKTNKNSCLDIINELENKLNESGVQYEKIFKEPRNKYEPNEVTDESTKEIENKNGANNTNEKINKEPRNKYELNEEYVKRTKELGKQFDKNEELEKIDRDFKSKHEQNGEFEKTTKDFRNKYETNNSYDKINKEVKSKHEINDEFEKITKELNNKHFEQNIQQIKPLKDYFENNRDKNAHHRKVNDFLEGKNLKSTTNDCNNDNCCNQNANYCQSKIYSDKIYYSNTAKSTNFQRTPNNNLQPGTHLENSPMKSDTFLRTSTPYYSIPQSLDKCEHILESCKKNNDLYFLLEKHTNQNVSYENSLNRSKSEPYVNETKNVNVINHGRSDCLKYKGTIREQNEVEKSDLENKFKTNETKNNSDHDDIEQTTYSKNIAKYTKIKKDENTKYPSTQMTNVVKTSLINRTKHGINSKQIDDHSILTPSRIFDSTDKTKELIGNYIVKDLKQPQLSYGSKYQTKYSYNFDKKSKSSCSLYDQYKTKSKKQKRECSSRKQNNFDKVQNNCNHYLQFIGNPAEVFRTLYFKELGQFRKQNIEKSF